jgi:hypothetical protein
MNTDIQKLKILATSRCNNQNPVQYWNCGDCPLDDICDRKNLSNPEKIMKQASDMLLQMKLKVWRRLRRRLK